MTLANPGIFSKQNTWLKAFCTSLCLPAAMFASPRHLLMQVMLWPLYFIISPDLFGKALFGLRKLLPFLSAYWLFATLLGTEFPQMVFFSLRLILLVFAIVYLIGSSKLESFVADSRFICSNPKGKSAMFFLLATLHYIQNYRSLYMQREDDGKPSIKQGLQSLSALFVANLESSGTVLNSCNELLQRPSSPREIAGIANLLALAYICCNVLVYAF